MKRQSPITYAMIDEEIKQDLYGKGTYCKHCGQHAQMYRKPLSAAVARFLIRLYRAHQRLGDDRYFTTRELHPKDNKASTEGVLARFWGLTVIADASNKVGAPSGAHKLTDKGRRFVQNLEHVKSHAHIYNGELIKVDGELRNIEDILPDYEEVMKEI